MFLPALLKRLGVYRNTILLVLAGLGVACVASLLLMLLSALGVFDDSLANHPGPQFAQLATPSAPAGQANGSLPACLAGKLLQEAKVVEIVDGDTVRVLLDGNVRTVRYVGIDTPEVTQFVTRLGRQAADRNAELVTGQVVRLYTDVQDHDRNGRLLRYVVLGDTFINEVLVSEGLAEEQIYEPDVACAETLKAAEGDARAAALGIWQAADGAMDAPVSNPAEAASHGSYLPGTVLISLVDKEKEVVRLRNNSAADVDLDGWFIVSERGDQVCRLAGVLKEEAELNIYSQTGKGGYNCNFADPIWSNLNEDPAALYDPNGNLIDRR